MVIAETFRELTLNQRFHRYATTVGFRLRACEGYDPESKGKVEAGVKYVKKDGLYGETFADFPALEAHLARWLAETAHVRTHAVTGAAPQVRYDRDERAVMGVYRHLHTEPFEPDAGWDIPTTGPLSGANGALPWILFQRDRTLFENRFPQWRIERVEPLMPFAHLLSGGVSLRSLMPGWMYAPVRGLERLVCEHRWWSCMPIAGALVRRLTQRFLSRWQLAPDVFMAELRGELRRLLGAWLSIELLLVLAVLAADYFAVTAMLRAFGLSLPILAPLVLWVFLAAGSALPGAPGFVGTYQVAAVWSLGYFGVSAAIAVAVATVLQATTLAVVVAMAGPGAITSVRRLRTQANTA